MSRTVITRADVRYLVLEGLVVLFGVLIALLVDGWREELGRRDAADAAFQRIVQEDPLVEYEWRARTLPPIVAVYVIGVFLLFMALARFLFHSGEAVKALLPPALGRYVVSTSSSYRVGKMREKGGMRET